MSRFENDRPRRVAIAPPRLRIVTSDPDIIERRSTLEVFNQRRNASEREPFTKSHPQLLAKGQMPCVTPQNHVRKTKGSCFSYELWSEKYFRRIMKVSELDRVEEKLTRIKIFGTKAETPRAASLGTPARGGLLISKFLQLAELRPRSRDIPCAAVSLSAKNQAITAQDSHSGNRRLRPMNESVGRPNLSTGRTLEITRMSCANILTECDELLSPGERLRMPQNASTKWRRVFSEELSNLPARAPSRQLIHIHRR